MIFNNSSKRSQQPPDRKKFVQAFHGGFPGFHAFVEGVGVHDVGGIAVFFQFHGEGFKESPGVPAAGGAVVDDAVGVEHFQEGQGFVKGHTGTVVGATDTSDHGHAGVHLGHAVDQGFEGRGVDGVTGTGKLCKIA